MDTLFSSRFEFDDSPDDEAKICIVGVGGGGGNAVNNMVSQGIHGVEFIAINTDAQALMMNRASKKIQAGRGLTKGLGAGARPNVGAEAVEENREQIEQALAEFDMIFITAGMGGGTGTGGAPVVASIAKRLGILSVAIVTKPFECEGPRRLKAADQGIQALRESVDTLIVIPNERLLDISEDDTSLIEAFSMADEVLYNATRGISDLITVHGLINLDFADVKTTMHNGGKALMGAATASGEKRAERAAIEAISSPLLDGLSISGARNVLVNITAGLSLGIKEATEATSIIQREAGEDVEVIFGTVIDESMGDDLRITVIATGFDKEAEEQVPGRRPSVQLHNENPVFNYKGEENLKQLDIPAYQRRQHAPAPVISTEREEETHEEPSGPRRIRRLHVDDLKDRAERIRKDDPDTPAFLRKMLD
ncbi:MAG: cell division protein FtsZ [Bacteroidetes bacterium]|nr:cell division protein FtsZ [Bacteroidota bacterium]